MYVRPFQFWGILCPSKRGERKKKVKGKKEAEFVYQLPSLDMIQSYSPPIHDLIVGVFPNQNNPAQSIDKRNTRRRGKVKQRKKTKKGSKKKKRKKKKREWLERVKRNGLFLLRRPGGTLILGDPVKHELGRILRRAVSVAKGPVVAEGVGEQGAVVATVVRAGGDGRAKVGRVPDAPVTD